MSWLGGGFLSLIMMAAVGSMTTLITLSLIRQSDGSSEGKAPPTLPPSPSTSLRQRDLQSSMSSTSPSVISPLPAFVQSPVFLPAPVSNSPINFVETVSSLSPTSSICTDMPGWYDARGYDCSWYEVMDVPGCPQYGDLYVGENIFGVANDNCCYCQNVVVSTLVSQS
jgi:hypothetical protein